MRACPVCGASNAPDDDFCSNCGSYLGWSEEGSRGTSASTTTPTPPAEGGPTAAAGPGAEADPRPAPTPTPAPAPSRGAAWSRASARRRHLLAGLVVDGRRDRP
ncbi:zinc-ribbon domain-containing protein, partial [Streptomyces sp. NPDC002586]